MANVFISYARRDRERVAQLTSALEGEGLSVWWDPDLLPGRRYRQIIADELEIADAVIVVWTAASLESDWVQDEAEEGRQRGVLIPVVFEPVRPPAGFRQVQAAELSQWTGSPQHPEFRSLVFAIRSLVQIAKASGRAAAVAPGREIVHGERDEPEAATVAEAPPAVRDEPPPAPEPAPAPEPPPAPPPVPKPVVTPPRGGSPFRIVLQWPLWVGVAVVMAGLVAIIGAATEANSAAYLWSLVPLPAALLALAARRTGVGDRSAKILGWISAGVFLAALAIILVAALASGDAPSFIISLSLLLALAAASVVFAVGAAAALMARLARGPASPAPQPSASPQAAPDGGLVLRFLFGWLCWGLVAAVMAGLVLLGVAQDQFTRLGTFLICLAPLAAGWTASAGRRSGTSVRARRIVALVGGAGLVAALLVLFAFRSLRAVAHDFGLVSILFTPSASGLAFFGLLGASVAFAIAAATALIATRRS